MYSSGLSVKSLKQESAVAAATLSDKTGSHMLLPVPCHSRRAERPVRQHSLRRIADFPRRHGACRPQVQP